MLLGVKPQIISLGNLLNTLGNKTCATGEKYLSTYMFVNLLCPNSLYHAT